MARNAVSPRMNCKRLERNCPSAREGRRASTRAWARNASSAVTSRARRYESFRLRRAGKDDDLAARLRPVRARAWGCLHKYSILTKPQRRSFLSGRTQERGWVKPGRVLQGPKL